MAEMACMFHLVTAIESVQKGFNIGDQCIKLAIPKKEILRFEF